MWKARNDQREGVLLELGYIEVSSILALPSMPPPILAVVQHFQEVFGFPSPWSHDHSITLQPNAVPISVQLYHYPHFQKEEIEKLVWDIWQWELFSQVCVLSLVQCC